MRREDAKALIKWAVMGLSQAEFKSLKGKFKLAFDKRSYESQCPTMDDSIARRLKRKYGHSAVDGQENSLLSLQSLVLERRVQAGGFGGF